LGRWRLLFINLVRGMIVRFGHNWIGDRISRRVMLSLLEGYRSSAMLQVAGKLGIADLLADGPRSSHELAQCLGADNLSMRRFLRGLVAYGICSEQKDGSFGLTKLGVWLQASKPGSLRSQAIRSSELYAAWGSLMHSVMTGETAFVHLFGADVWDYRKRDPELDEGFNQAFRESSTRIARELMAAYDFSSICTIADIGGGYGALLGVILRNSPSLTGILFDQPHVIAKAATHLKEAGVFERCRTVGGDFFDHVPDGADLYIAKSVVHDWNDKECKHILNNFRKVLKPGRKLLLIERIMPDRARQGRNTVMLDLRMLIVTGGRERSESEFRSIFEAAGLTLKRIIPLPSGFNIIEGANAETRDSSLRD
jgi:hypothetical protein